MSQSRSSKSVNADVSIVIAGHREAAPLKACLASAKDALAALKAGRGLSGEIVLVDTAGSSSVDAPARSAGVRTVATDAKGYGAAVRAGLSAAQGRYLVIGPADGSYDFADCVPMVEALADGAGLCMGSRFAGSIESGAMPLGRRVGNHLLTALVDLLFGARIGDVHCGLRAVSRACYERLDLSGAGSEISSEMVVKAALRNEIIDQTPVRFARTPHGGEGAWRDGWRHVRYVFMLSPSWIFALPALVGSLFGLWILARTGWSELNGALATSTLGNYWVILAAAILSLSHLGGLLAVAGELYGVREGYRRPGPIAVFLARRLTLETMLLAGGALFLSGGAVLAFVAFTWIERHFMRVYSVYPAVLGTLLMTLGAQTILGGFLLAIIGGNQTRFLQAVPVPVRPTETRRTAAKGATAEGLTGQHAFVVPAYGNSPFLADCLRSIRAQTLPARLYVTTSTPSAQIAEAAREFGATLVVNPDRRGIASDWNFALRTPKARWVTLAHQDDVYYPAFLERTLELFDRSRSGSIAFTGYDEIDDAGVAKSSKISKVKHAIQLFALGSKEEIQRGRLRMILSFGNTLPCSTVTYDLERIGTFEFSDQYASNLDWDAWWRLANRGEAFLHTHERLVGRRHNDLTATSQLIRDGRRRREDIQMFRRFWPRPVSDALAYLYRAGY